MGACLVRIKVGKRYFAILGVEPNAFLSLSPVTRFPPHELHFQLPFSPAWLSAFGARLTLCVSSLSVVVLDRLGSLGIARGWRQILNREMRWFRCIGGKRTTNI